MYAVQCDSKRALARSLRLISTYDSRPLTNCTPHTILLFQIINIAFIQTMNQVIVKLILTHCSIEKATKFCFQSNFYLQVRHVLKYLLY